MFKEILGDAFPIIMKVAPSIANALGSPVAGTAAMIGLNLIGNALGVNPTQVTKLKEQILNDPDAPDKLSTLEQCFSDWFKVNASSLKMPIKAEVNIKLEWSDSHGSA